MQRTVQKIFSSYKLTSITKGKKHTSSEKLGKFAFEQARKAKKSGGGSTKKKGHSNRKQSIARKAINNGHRKNKQTIHDYAKGNDRSRTQIHSKRKGGE